VEKVFEDRVSAREFLLQAEGFLADADAASLSAPSRAVLIHQATVSACDAILQSAGFRVTSGDGSHMLRIQAALEQVDGNTEELLERLDASRAPQRSVLRGAVRRRSQRCRCARCNQGTDGARPRDCALISP